MRFEEFASKAGKAASNVGRGAQRPSFARLRHERNRRTLFAGLSSAAAAAVIVLGVVVLWPGSEAVPPLAAVDTTTTTVTPGSVAGDPEGREACPVTEPENNSFIPVEAAPDGPPDLYDSVWYGTPELWTMINHGGQVWSKLPVGPDGSLTQKTFWWAEGYVFDEEPAPNITVTAEHLDGSAPTVQAGGPGTNGTHPDLGSFMLIGLEIPEEGCWKITAEYRDATLSYVVWVGYDSADSDS